MFGQAEHVANFSFLFKDGRYGWNGQLSFSYTGERLCVVSRYVDEDSWQAGYLSMDASIEKKFKRGLTLFGKASNLTNSPMIQYTKRNETNESIPNVERYHGGVIERKEYYGLNFSFGLRFTFN